MYGEKMFLFSAVFASFISITGISNAATCELVGKYRYPGSFASQSLAIADVQKCVADAVDGDTVRLKAGSVDWGSSYMDVNPSKNINIIGAGIDQTNITVNQRGIFFMIRNKDKAGFRLSGMTFQGTTMSQPIIKIHSLDGITTSSYGWRVDHVKTNFTGAPRHVMVQGPTWGLFDHCDFTSATGNMFLVTGLIAGDTPYSGSYDLSLPLDLGTEKAVYVEDSTFTFTTEGGAPAFFDMAGGGGRIVFRHNTATGGYMYNHWTRYTEVAGLKYEVYNNVFVGTAAWGVGGGEYPSRFEAGTGVIFNNTVTGFNDTHFYIDERRGCGNESNAPLLTCNGSRAWDGNIEASGWPCLGQIGRGTGTVAGSQPSVPLYAWNNGMQAKCAHPAAAGVACVDTVKIAVMGCNTDLKTTGSEHSNGDVDYVNNGTTQKPGYRPYTYPHPLTRPEPARNLRIGN